MIISTDNFWRDHSDDDDGTVVLREQPATAIYWNENGAAVVRQERAWDEDSDTLIIIQPENVSAVARALLALIDPAKRRPPRDDRGEVGDRRGDRHGDPTGDGRLPLTLPPPGTRSTP